LVWEALGACITILNESIHLTKPCASVPLNTLTVDAVLFDNTIRPNPFFNFSAPPGSKPWQLGADDYCP